ncbi:MAG: TonB-dependent receptor plug domain-containing protein [Gemmatimonadetes bacterium]|nr:TonB-dependent receptor plug domain-containing protein [Gemmatimonadota bacterium]MYC91750.1 TonB-dependent receptor plug domain-containing protein [Gemmatimonadota bacterium]MYJ19018.1 TonB-dependent receptor plug domain-containing protein [Gemmatimonadota bacterium]
MKRVRRSTRTLRRVRRVWRFLAARDSRLATESRLAACNALTLVLPVVIAAAPSTLAPTALPAQAAQVLAALRGETGVDPDPGTLLATISMLSVERTPLGDALVRLAERSSVQIAFSPSLLPADLRVDCDCAALNLAKTLDHLLAYTDLGYVELGSQVVVVPRAGSDLAPPDGLLRGRVRSEVAVPIEDATVRLRPAADTTQGHIIGTDRLGYFAFHDLAAGDYELSVDRIGYGVHQETIAVAPGDDLQVAIQLAEEAVELAGVQVEGERSRQRTRFERSAGATVRELSRTELKAIPGIAEADPIKSVDVLPGVTRMSDFGAAFNVRGGSADQNLILLDGIPIFSPFHTLGLFSAFNADMVGRAELQLGGFPAEYGGRVSSVLRIESDPGDEEFGVDAGLSLLASRAAVRGGLPDGLKNRLGLASGRWRASARRSYLDALIEPFSEGAFPYHLQDFQAAFEGWTRRGDRVKATGYLSRDVLDVASLASLNDTWPALDSRVPEIVWNWGNAAAGASWTRLLGDGGALEVGGSLSSSDAYFEFSDASEAGFGTGISRSSIAASLERHPGRNTRWKSGIESTWSRYENLATGGSPEPFPVGEGTGFGTAAYTQLDWTPNATWVFEGGVRVDHWRPRGASSTVTVSPRIAAKRFVGGGRWAVRAAGGRYTQFLHSVRDEQIPFGLDAWVLSGQQAPPLISDQVQAGLEGWLGTTDTWFTSLEAYYRTQDGLVARNWGDHPADPADDLFVGDGRAYGADFLLRRNAGLTTGWLSVSLLKADRRLPGDGAGPNAARTVQHPADFDRRLEVDLVIRHALPWAVTGGLRWNLGTGLPYTLPLRDYHVTRHELMDLTAEPFDRSVVLLGPRNGERYPVSHRLDVSFRRTWEKGWGRITPYLHVINVYNRKNVLYYSLAYRTDRTVLNGVSMSPLLPTIGVEVSF